MNADPRIATWKAALALKGEARTAALARIAKLDREHAVECDGDCDECADAMAPTWEGEPEAAE